jgi:nitroimidazol reductase NimA-like FMN-containing flavoprotein (pyridoxamine 5'-phosphate oxidase superfamily)
MKDNIDEPMLNSTGQDKDHDDDSASTETRLRRLAHGQLYGVLCTQADEQPYGSVVAFVFTEDLTKFVFATAAATRKYRLLQACPNVALVVDSQSDFPRDMMKIEAFTVTGKVAETKSSDWAQRLIERHPQLKSFIESPSTCVFVVDTVRFFIVNAFQEVREWTASRKDSE